MSVSPRVAFVLEVEEELRLHGEARQGGRRSRATQRAVEELARTLVPAGVPLVDLASAPDLSGSIVHAFVPSDRIRTEVRRLGGRLVAGPGDDVLRTVLRRDFAYLHELPGAFATRSPDEAMALLERAPPTKRRAKRAVGLAGIGHRVFEGLDAETRAFVAASRHGLLVEPEVTIEREFSLHGFLAPDGTLTVGAPCVLSSTRGTYRSARLATGDELDRAGRAALAESLLRASSALRGAGFHGPFGVDAYVGRLDGAPIARWQGEINARYTMAWGIGMGSRRPDLEAR